MVRISAYINLLQNQIGIDKKSALGLKLGELLTAKILKVSPELALLELKEQKILAELKTNLQPGDEVKVRVAGEQQNRIILKIIDDSASTSSPLDQLLNKSGVQPDKDARTALDFLLKNNLPVTPQTLRALITDQKMPLLQIINKIFYQGSNPPSFNQNLHTTQQTSFDHSHTGANNTTTQQNALAESNQFLSPSSKANLLSNTVHGEELLPITTKSTQVSSAEIPTINHSISHDNKDNSQPSTDAKLDLKNPQNSKENLLSNIVKTTDKSIKNTQKQIISPQSPKPQFQEAQPARSFEQSIKQDETPQRTEILTHNTKPIKSRLVIKVDQLQQYLLDKTANQKPLNLKKTFTGEAQTLKSPILLSIKNYNNLLQFSRNEQLMEKQLSIPKKIASTSNTQVRNTSILSSENPQSQTHQRSLEQLGLILNPERTLSELVRGLKSLIQNLGLLKKSEESAELAEKSQLSSLSNSPLNQEQKEGVRELLDKFLAVRLRQKSDDLLLHLDIPILFNQPGTALLQIREDHNQPQQDTRHRPLNIFFNLDIESLGKVRILILLAGKEMSCQFSAQSEKTRLLLRKHMPELKDRLEEMSFQVTGLGVSTLLEEEPESLSFPGQIDFRV